MIRIEVKSTEVKIKSGVGKNGRAYEIVEQTAYLHKGEPYPEKITLRVENGSVPFATGMYTLGDDSVYVGDYGQLRINPRLVPLPASGTARAASGSSAA